MKRALAVFSLSFFATGCATLGQETATYGGPFGRTEIGAYVLAADPSSSRLLVQTYDGDLWVHDVTDRAAGGLAALTVGDEVSLAFDDRVAGRRVVDIDRIESGRNPPPGGIVSVAEILPYGVRFGAPATRPSGVIAARADTVAPGGIPFVGTGVVGGTAFGHVVAPGVLVPGFWSFSTLPSGALTPRAAASLGIVPGLGVVRTAGDGTVVVGAGGARAPVRSGNVGPRTGAPGVTTVPGTNRDAAPRVRQQGVQGSSSVGTAPGQPMPGTGTVRPGTSAQPATTTTRDQ